MKLTVAACALLIAVTLQGGPVLSAPHDQGDQTGQTNSPPPGDASDPLYPNPWGSDPNWDDANYSDPLSDVDTNYEDANWTSVNITEYSDYSLENVNGTGNYDDFWPNVNFTQYQNWLEWFNGTGLSNWAYPLANVNFTGYQSWFGQWFNGNSSGDSNGSDQPGNVYDMGESRWEIQSKDEDGDASSPISDGTGDGSQTTGR